MNAAQIVDTMDKWLVENYDNPSPKKIAGGYLATVSKIECGSYDEAAHLKWMLGEMRTMTDTEKLMRWIGFMQGALWSLGYVSIDQWREMNTHGGV